MTVDFLIALDTLAKCVLDSCIEVRDHRAHCVHCNASIPIRKGIVRGLDHSKGCVTDLADDILQALSKPSAVQAMEKEIRQKGPEVLGPLDKIIGGYNDTRK